MYSSLQHTVVEFPRQPINPDGVKNSTCQYPVMFGYWLLLKGDLACIEGVHYASIYPLKGHFCPSVRYTTGCVIPPFYSKACRSGNIHEVLISWGQICKFKNLALIIIRPIIGLLKKNENLLIRKFVKSPKSEIRENLNMRKLSDLQYGFGQINVWSECRQCRNPH